MNLNLDQVLLNLDGSPLMDGTEPVTLKKICVSACLNAIGGGEDAQLSSEKKLSLYRVALAVSNGGVVDVSVEDRALLKERIGKMYFPLIVGRAFTMLETEAV